MFHDNGTSEVCGTGGPMHQIYAFDRTKNVPEKVKPNLFLAYLIPLNLYK